jgi:hypothetical protein
LAPRIGIPQECCDCRSIGVTADFQETNEVPAAFGRDDDVCAIFGAIALDLDAFVRAAHHLDVLISPTERPGPP